MVVTTARHVFAVPRFSRVLRRAERPGHRVDFLPFDVRSPVKRCRPKFLTGGNAFGSRFLDGIGSTEMLYAFPAFQKCKRGAAVSRARYEAKIVDDRGESLGAGETANIWVRGASAFANTAHPRLTGHHSVAIGS